MPTLSRRSGARAFVFNASGQETRRDIFNASESLHVGQRGSLRARERLHLNRIATFRSELVPGGEQRWNDLYSRVVVSRALERMEGGSDVMQGWFDVWVTSIGPTSGHLVGIFFNDVSARRSAEHALGQRTLQEDTRKLAVSPKKRALTHTREPDRSCDVDGVADRQRATRSDDCYRTTRDMIFRPAKCPMSAPPTTSLNQCRLLYMRAPPTADARPYNSGVVNRAALGCA